MKADSKKREIAEFCKSKNVEFLVWVGKGYLNIFSDEFIAPEELMPHKAPHFDSFSNVHSPESGMGQASRQQEIINDKYQNIDCIGERINLEMVRNFIIKVSSDKHSDKNLYYMRGINGYGTWPGIISRPQQFLTRHHRILEGSLKIKYLREELKTISESGKFPIYKHHADRMHHSSMPLTMIGWREKENKLSGGEYEEYETEEVIEGSRIIPIGIPLWLGVDRNDESLFLRRKNYGRWAMFGQRLQNNLTQLNVPYATNACIAKIVPRFILSPNLQARGYKGHEEYFDGVVVQPCFLLSGEKA